MYIVYRVSFIFRLNAFLVSVCTKGFAYCFSDAGNGTRTPGMNAIYLIFFSPTTFMRTAKRFFSLPQGASVAVDTLQKEIITTFPTVQSNHFFSPS